MAPARIGASERGGTFWLQGEALAAVLERRSGFRCRVVEAARASVENARSLQEGRIDFGFMASNWIGRAKDGAPPFDAPMDVRMVAPANSGAMFFIARAEGNLRKVRELAGKRVSIGPENSGMAQHAHAVFGALGIREIAPVHLSFADGGAALEAGEVDAQWQCPYPNPVMRDLSLRLDVRVLDYGTGEVERVIREAGFYRPAVMPAGVFRGASRETAQLAVVNVVAAHARQDPETVRALVAAMLGGLDELAAANALFTGLGELFEPLRAEGPQALEFGGVPLHPGALAAYREAGYLK